MNKSTKEAQYIFSLCSGHNFYIPCGEQEYKIFGKDKVVIEHVKTGEYFYISKFPTNAAEAFDLNAITQLIRKPAARKNHIWPVDIVALEDGEEAQNALVFPLRSLPAYNNFSALLTNDMNMGWDRPWVQKFSKSFLDACGSFADSGYAYHEFSYGNMFYDKETFEVMFDFSFSAHKADGLFDGRKVPAERITSDFADTFYYTPESAQKMDLASDFYSVAVILFKLLIGRLPYQGAVMEHEPNHTPQEHLNWLKVYHKNPYFIFDENDDINHIGGETGFAKDEIFVDRWNNLPERLKQMFCDVFRTENVLRKSENLTFYSPKEFKAALFG